MVALTYHEDFIRFAEPLLKTLHFAEPLLKTPAGGFCIEFKQSFRLGLSLGWKYGTAAWVTAGHGGAVS